MGFLDKLRKKAEPLADKAQEAVADHGDKVDAGIDKVAEVADKVTKGKHSDKIDQAADKAKEAVDKVEGDDGKG